MPLECFSACRMFPSGTSKRYEDRNPCSFADCDALTLSGAATFSIVKQSAALNCFPPLKVVQTSGTVAGQVYLPAVNWWLMVGSIAVVAAFQTTVSIGHAFGATPLSKAGSPTFLASEISNL